MGFIRKQLSTIDSDQPYLHIPSEQQREVNRVMSRGAPWSLGQDFDAQVLLLARYFRTMAFPLEECERRLGRWLRQGRIDPPQDGLAEAIEEARLAENLLAAMNIARGVYRRGDEIGYRRFVPVPVPLKEVERLAGMHLGRLAVPTLSLLAQLRSRATWAWKKKMREEASAGEWELPLPQALILQPWFVGASRGNYRSWLRVLMGKEPLPNLPMVMNSPMLALVSEGRHRVNGPGEAARYLIRWTMDLEDESTGDLAGCYEYLLERLRDHR